jgi:hypothetical protein
MKIMRAFFAAALLAVIGSGAANALPFPPTLFQPAAGALQPYQDGIFVLQPAPPPVGAISLAHFTATYSDINPCSGVNLVGGCFFQMPNPSGIPMNSAMEDRFTVVYQPNSTIIDAIFGIQCGNGSCTMAFLSRMNGQTIDLTGVDTSNFFGVTELSGVPSTVFDATYYLDPTFVQNQHGFARFIVSAVPEPVTLSLFGAGLAGAVAMRRRKKQA